MKQELKGRLQALPRRLRRRLGKPSSVRDFQVVSTAGYRVHGRLWSPRSPRAAVVLCPGTSDPGAVFESWMQPLDAREIAALGVAAVIFDPPGRGRSWGPEDYGGPEHQDALACVLRWVHAELRPATLGVVAISLGLCMATGCLASEPELPVDWLLDWEGPSDREIITAGGRRMEPALGHGLDDELYWSCREPVQRIQGLRCGYMRVQSSRDHAQPGELRHAHRMLQAVARGDAAWFQLNEHPRGVVPERPRWYPPGRVRANAVLTSWIRRLT